MSASAAVPTTLPVTHPVLIVAISAVIFVLAPLLLERLRVPGLVGVIAAGALIGPNGLNVLARSNTIVLLGTVGLLYLMFIAGIEIDLHDFRRHRNHSVLFGALTFLLPQGLGTAVMLAVGYEMATAVLIASMFASHTLLAYPIALRLGIGKTRAVTAAVGGTIITDTAALLVLAVIAASTRGALDAAFWARLTIGLGLYVAAVLLLLPRITRWFFRSGRTGAVSEYVFVFAALFVGSFLAEVAGVEAIVGAFLVGLALNRLIPEQSILANRIHFVGEAIFIPFFLLSVGMLVDVRVLAGDARVWVVMLAMTSTVIATKAAAALVAARWFGYGRDEGWTMFGLSVPQAAATLAATIIGLQIGLFDEAVLNGTILMILATVVLGPWVVERFGRRVALAEERNPMAAAGPPQRILVPLANPATAGALMELALALREPDSREPVHPLTVVPAQGDGALIDVALAEKLLSHAVAHAAATGVPVIPLTRVDHNFASGIGRGALETRSSTIVIGWDARRTTRHAVFGTVLDQLLEDTWQEVVVARLAHPLATTRRLVLVIPRGSRRLPGFAAAARGLKLMASRLGAALEGYVVGTDPAPYASEISALRPDVPVRLERVDEWRQVPARLRREAGPDDLVVLLSARRGTVAWHPALARLPALLGSLEVESFLVLHPSELDPMAGAESRDPHAVLAVPPSHVLLDLPASGVTAAAAGLLRARGDEGPPTADELRTRLLHEPGAVAEFGGVLVPHLRVPGLAAPELFVGISPEGIGPTPSGGAAHVLLLLLTPAEPPEEHLRALTQVARAIGDPARVRALQAARTPAEVARILASAGGAPDKAAPGSGGATPSGAGTRRSSGR